MAIATPRPPAAPVPTTKSLPVVGRSLLNTEAKAEWWVEPLRWIALAVFIFVPIFSLVDQRHAGRVVWTILIACLPLFIVLVGYHRWRRICPLAFFSQLPVLSRRPGSRKASHWLESNYYFVAFSVFFFSLWLRLVATNGDGQAIATFFIVISFAAVAVGFIYTGKTWCNYICPVSFIEKIYTEPHGLRQTLNSECTKCTACKKFCPDINEENGYWKEIDSRSKRFVYFAFPGLVWGFYFYYYLQAGKWLYYFSGRWTNEPGLFAKAFGWDGSADTAGFFFLPIVGRAVASLLTLALCALASYLLFSLLERPVGKWLRRRDAETDGARVRHVMMSLAAFTAFVTFYSFAGAPTLWRLPWIVPQLFLITVILTATLSLARRLRRTQKIFAEETVAQNIIKRWAWTDMQPPKDLREAFLIHTIRSQETKKESAHVLEVYQDAVRETLVNGFVTREEVHLLEALRNQLHIKQADHEKVMAALADEERALISSPNLQLTVEKRLQLETYKRALESYLEEVAADGSPDDLLIRELRREYRVTKKEHEAVLDELLGGERGVAARLAEEVATIERSAQTIQILELNPTPTHNFLAFLLQRRRARSVESLMRALSFALETDEIKAIRDALCSGDEAQRGSVVEHLMAHLSPTIAERLFKTQRETALIESSMPTLTDLLSARTHSTDPYIRAVALYAMSQRGTVEETMLVRMAQDEHEIVRETAAHLQRERAGREAAETSAPPSLIIIEKMLALRTTPIFSSLAPEGLAELARASIEDTYAPGQTLCVEGETGNEVFILLAGDVKILYRDGANQRVVAKESAGGFVGEMSALDPAPRSATVIGGENGVRVLRLNGIAFRNTLDANPSIAASVIRTLAQRLRETHQNN